LLCVGVDLRLPGRPARLLIHANHAINPSIHEPLLHLQSPGNIIQLLFLLPLSGQPLDLGLYAYVPEVVSWAGINQGPLQVHVYPSDQYGRCSSGNQVIVPSGQAVVNLKLGNFSSMGPGGYSDEAQTADGLLMKWSSVRRLFKPLASIRLPRGPTYLWEELLGACQAR
jgi:hypothetical protein